MVSIVKVPGINGLGRTKGCERAGNAILDALKDIHTNEQGKPIDVALLDLEEIHLDNKNPGLTNKLIYENCLEIFKEKPKTIFLGGDHSISYSINRAFLDACRDSEREPCLIVFDAHADCLTPSIASKRGFPTNREWIRGLVEAGFPGKNIMIVGARNMERAELNFLKEQDIRIISMNQIVEDIQDTCDIIMEFSDGKDLYVSIDIDVVDPSSAPSTAHPEPGGLASRQFIYMIQRINKIRNLRGLDLTEINEKNDKDKTTVKLGAKILAELL
jgi:agmatinase